MINWEDAAREVVRKIADEQDEQGVDITVVNLGGYVIAAVNKSNFEEDTGISLVRARLALKRKPWENIPRAGKIIRVYNTIVGAVGVSGAGSAESDEKIAEQVVRKIEEKIVGKELVL